MWMWTSQGLTNPQKLKQIYSTCTNGEPSITKSAHKFIDLKFYLRCYNYVKPNSESLMNNGQSKYKNHTKII